MNKLPNWLQVALVVLVVVLLVFLYLWQEWRVIYLQRKVTELEEELIPLLERKRELQMDKARYFSYERVERIAKERLGMVVPEVLEEEPEPDEDQGTD